MEPRYKLKTAAAFSPVTIAELKSNLRILHTDQDTYLQALLDAAVVDAQEITGRQFARATYTAYLDSYPSVGELELTLGPVAAISSVKYYAQDAIALTTVSASDYQLDNVELTARLRFLNSFSTDSNKMNAVEIEFTTGWATAAEIEKSIKDAIILIASERFLTPDNAADNYGSGVKLKAADRLLQRYKVQRY